MKELWRISAHSDLTGLAGERTKGRWHTPEEGKRIIYLAEHPALALLEVIVNIRVPNNTFPTHYQLMKIAVDRDISEESIAPESLSKTWRSRQEETQFLGDAWLSQRRSALLSVPSAPVPESTNYLLNPLHPDAANVKIEWCRWIEYDHRLFRTGAYST